MSRLLVIACIATLLLQPAAWADGCIGLADRLGTPLEPHRIVRVPEHRQTEALELLGQKTFTPLTQLQESQLLSPRQVPDYNSLLTRQAEDAEDKAAQCRRMATVPFFANKAGFTEHALAEASKYERYAAYTRSLAAEDLHPYLVKAKVLFEGTGAYRASLQDHRLSLSHGSLGRGAMEPRNVAVIVYVEGNVEDVGVSYSAAE